MTDNRPAVSHANQNQSPVDHAESRIIRQSTCVLLDSGSPPQCAACGARIDCGNKYKTVTVEQQDGRVTDLSFCGDGCRSSLL